MAALKTVECNCRLIKGQVFLWPGATDLHDLVGRGRRHREMRRPNPMPPHACGRCGPPLLRKLQADRLP
jgi:hypothetical protein